MAPGSSHRARCEGFLLALQRGASHRAACAESGIGRATLHRWVSGSRPTDAAMRDRIAEAEGQFESQMLQHIAAAAALVDHRGNRPHWTAAAWLLERRWPEEYGKRTPEFRVAPIEPTSVSPPPLPDSALKERLAGILEVLDRAGQLPQEGSHVLIRAEPGAVSASDANQ